MSRPAHPCPKVLSFGEILWDIFGDRETIGGAPFNVAAHLAQFGIQSHFYSRIGSDRRGSLARHRLLDLGVSDTWLQVDPTRATGRVNVSLDAAGQPSYAIGADAAWDAIEAPTPPIADELVIENFSALVCGTLAQRSKGNQRALAAIRAILPGVPVFYDVNLRGSETPLATVLQTLPGTTLVKMNEAEMVAIAEKILGRVPPAEDFYSALHDRYGVRVLLCTRGAEGCPVHHEGGDAFTSPVRPVEVACNPLIATIYPTNKTTKLNHFHAWFPGGIVIGGLVSYALNATGFGWKVQFASMALPLAVYGFMFVGQKFPRTERVEQGISTGAMFAACVRPGFLLMVACMMMTAATELGPGQWIPDILSHAGVSGILVLVWITGLMAVGRQFAGPFVHKLSSTGMLLMSAVLSAAGLYLMSKTTGSLLFASATIFAFGVCFFWPTMLGYVSENYPKTGALGLAIMGGAGMLSAGYMVPMIGKFYDQGILARLPAGADLATATMDIQSAAGLETLGKVAVVPVVLAVVFLGFWFSAEEKNKVSHCRGPLPKRSK